MLQKFLTARARETGLDRWLLVVLLLSACQAYQVGPLPIPFLAQLMVVAQAFGNRTWYHQRIPKGSLLIALAIGIGILGQLESGTMYSDMLPPAATTAYPIFIALRYWNVFVFLATPYALLQRRQSTSVQSMYSAIRVAGVLVAIFALYVLIAQALGLPEPPRNRVGTSGLSEQATSFAVTRALGSFREPSHLAEWLLLPLCISFAQAPVWQMVCIGSAFLLTVSLGGVVGAVAAIAVAVASSALAKKTRARPARTRSTLVPIAVAAGLTVAVYLFGATLTQFMFTRIVDIAQGGLAASNRFYIVQYIQAVSPPMFGPGLGNSNIAFSTYLGVPAIASFTSLALYALYSLGTPGAMLMAIGLARLAYPGLALLKVDGAGLAGRALASAIGGGLVLALGLSEEPSLIFGLALSVGMLAYSGVME